MQKVNLIWAHPRQDSLTAKVVSAVKQVISDRGLTVHETDLYRLDFNPVLWKEDEPDWNDSKKMYSPAVREYASQLSEDVPLVIIFPVWWCSLPAILKGYIDKVWNNGISYGEGATPPASKILWIGLVGEDHYIFTKREYDVNIQNCLNTGIAGYCGVTDSRVELLCNTLEVDINIEAQHYDGLLNQARQATKQFLTG